jgi:hypothetical protein
MALDLSSYTSIQSNLFVKMDVPGYQVLTFTDYHKDYTIGSDTYQSLGELLNITTTTDELRATPKEVGISISGVPSSNVSEILDNRIKGSSVTVKRGLFDVTTGELIVMSGNPAPKFEGIVSNFDIANDLDMGSDTGSITITLNITNIVELLNNKVNGRRTNPIDFPAQELMSRVSALAKSNFNFGAPK